MSAKPKLEGKGLPNRISCTNKDGCFLNSCAQSIVPSGVPDRKGRGCCHIDHTITKKMFSLGEK